MARTDKECILPIEEGWGVLEGMWSGVWGGGGGGDVDDGGRLPASSGVSK